MNTRIVMCVILFSPGIHGQILLEETVVEELAPKMKKSSAWQTWQLPDTAKTSSVELETRDQRNVSYQLLDGGVDTSKKIEKNSQLELFYGSQQGAKLSYGQEQTALMLAYERKNEVIEYLDLGGSLSDDSDNFISSYRPEAKTYELGLVQQLKKGEVEGRFRAGDYDVYSGTQLNGRSKFKSAAVVYQASPSATHDLSFLALAKGNSFATATMELADFDREQSKLGAVWRWRPTQQVDWLVDLGQTNLKSEKALEHQAYSRQAGKGELKLSQRLKNWRFYQQLGAAAQKDRFFKESQMRYPLMAQANVEFEGFKAIPFNMRVLYQRVSPTPELLFGDGELVLGNRQLEDKKTLLYSLGPGLKLNKLTASLSYFQERTQDEISYTAANAMQAKPINIGGVWAQGLVLEAEYKLKDHKVQLNYTWQDALNDSQLEWQRGYRLPDRPEHAVELQLEGSIKKISYGTSLRYSSETPLDFTEQLYRDEQWILSQSFKYRLKNYFAQLTVDDLLAGQSRDVGFQNRNGQALIDPGLRSTSFLFTLGAEL